jgi:hypothetical protein
MRVFENATEAQRHDRHFKAAWHCALTRRAAFGDADDLPQGADHAWREVSDRELSHEAEVDALHAAFRLVADASDWKAPICAVVNVPADEPPAAFRALLARAVEYFTATTPTFVEIVTDGLGLKLRVEAAGYRRGPAGDH